MQLSCLKSGRNLPPFIIFKGAYPPPNKNPIRNTVAYDIKHLLADNAGDHYPPHNDMYITCSKTENKNGDLTIDILQEIIFPGIAIFEGKRGCVLVDDLKGHSREIDVVRQERIRIVNPQRGKM